MARLVATAAIFVFHYSGLLGYSQHKLDLYAILIYSFLSGYLVNVSKSNKLAWVVRRYSSIMIPYWIVILPVIIVNHIIQYKSVSPSVLLVTILGGNLFLTNPLYVIGWYISFVLLLYIYAFLESLCDSRPAFILMCMVIGVIVFFFWLRVVYYYFLIFLAGLRIAAWKSAWHRPGESAARDQIADVLFVAQRYCYSFFLIHGPVLFFFIKKTPLSASSLFVLPLLVSAILSVVIHTVSKRIQAIAANKALTLTEKMLSRFSAA